MYGFVEEMCAVSLRIVAKEIRHDATRPMLHPLSRESCVEVVHITAGGVRQRGFEHKGVGQGIIQEQVFLYVVFQVIGIVVGIPNCYAIDICSSLDIIVLQLVSKYSLSLPPSYKRHLRTAGIATEIAASQGGFVERVRFQPIFVVELEIRSQHRVYMHNMLRLSP